MRKTRKSVGSLASDGFVVRYALTGPSAVPIDPGEVGSAPDYVRQVLHWAERALEVYTGAPFHLPNPVGKERITIRVKRFPALGRASRKREIILHNDLAPDLLALTVAHELFHVIQYQYPRNSGRWRDAVIEGGAVYAEQFVTEKPYDASDDRQGRLRSFRRIVQEPHRPLTLAAYDCALFWDYIGRQAAQDGQSGEPGPRLYRSVLERCASHGFTAASVRRALGTKVCGTDLYRFRYDSPRPNAVLFSAETLIGNFAMAACLADNGFVSGDRRLVLVEDPDRGQAVGLAVAGVGRAAGRATRFQTLKGEAGLVLEGTVGDFGSLFHGVDFAPMVDTVQVRLSAQCPDRAVLLQIGLVDGRGRLVDIVRSDRRSFIRTISLSRPEDRIERLFLVVTGIARAAEFQVSVSAVPPQPDVMLTRWDAPPARELEAAVLNGARTWRSPDLSAGNGSGAAGMPTAGSLQMVDATLRNRGGADAGATLLRLFYQWSDGLPQGARWRPLRTGDNRPARQTVEQLPAGSTRQVPVEVIWPRRGQGKGLFILATASCANDANDGNKSAITRVLSL